MTHLKSPLDWPRAHPPLVEHCSIRSFAEDFQVDEIPPCQPSGQGEHLWLRIQKKGLNTQEVADRIAGLACVHPKHVSFAGMKDKHAVTTQWFSVHLPGKENPDLSLFSQDDLHCLEAHRHDKKLQRGALRGNHFALILRDCRGSLELLPKRLDLLSQTGIPDYFGEQRFGREAGNLGHFQALIDGKIPKDRHKRSLLFSSARSYLFNCLLAKRVELGNWNQILPGELVMLEGSHSLFEAEACDASLTQRLADGDIHPTGPLAGEGTFLPTQAAGALEESVLMAYAELIEALGREGLKAARRPLRFMPKQLEWNWMDETTLKLSFTLPAGAYATAVLREFAAYEDRRGLGALLASN